jgi:signal transduction histidine kinase
MSHELRTPLNAVIGFSEMIAGGAIGPIDPRYQEYGNDIRNSGMHLLHVINDVLDLSKIEAGRLQLNERNVQLGDLAKSCMNLVRANAAERGVQIQLRSPERIAVLVDPVRMRQALLNLLSNAVKFSNNDDVVELAIYVNDSGAPCLSVTDRGIGMRPEDVDIALQPFRQLENAYARTYDGTGLGLPIASRLIELHGGALHIESVPGKGTVIEIRLPVLRLVSVASSEGV